jgi:polyisoprenoid-binding protein YceI
VAEPIEASTVTVTLGAASIDTGNPDRDAHLRSADFLDVKQFPALTFRSTGLQRLADDRWRLDGALTIRDVTRDVALDARYGGSGPDPWGGTRMAVVATTQLARRDYEIDWNMGLPGGLTLIGPTLRIDLDVQAVRQD